MKVSGSYARGDQPRSVPDPDGESYDAMVRRQRALNAKHDANFWASHPSAAEAILPVWGSAREAIADYQEGDMVGAAVNGALAVSDLVPSGYLVKTVGKGLAKGVWKGGSHSWSATRKWMGRRGLAEKGAEGHHAIIPNGRWGKYVPDQIKNQPWNIKVLPKETHRRIHTRFGGRERFSPIARTWVGTPTWAQAGAGLGPGRAIVGFDAARER